MNVHVIEAAITSTRPLETNSFHHTIFHGVARRDGKQMSRYIPLDEEDPPPLHIVRSGRFLPSVFQGLGSLVVCANLASRLEGIRSIRLVKVVLDKLVDVDLCLADSKCPRDADDHLEALPDIAMFHDSVGDYFEVLTPVAFRIRGRYSDTRPVEYQFSEKWDRRSGFIGPAMIRENPLLYGNRSYFMSEYVFELFRPFLNRDFFEHITIDV